MDEITLMVVEHHHVKEEKILFKRMVDKNGFQNKSGILYAAFIFTMGNIRKNSYN